MVCSQLILWGYNEHGIAAFGLSPLKLNPKPILSIFFGPFSTGIYRSFGQVRFGGHENIWRERAVCRTLGAKKS
jgi:hypothetical protein